MNEEWSRLKRSIGLANTTSTPANAVALKASLKRAVKDTVDRCRAERKRARALETHKDLSDEAVLEAARWTDRLPLRDYEGVLHLVPRLVNVVTLAEAVPVPGSGLKLPLDLHAIGARCSNAYFAPRRFAAVQLAFDSPRCRVLVFHTGRLVGTGCAGPMAARLSIMRAARQLAVEADVHLHVRNFQVINQVGAASIDARLDCDAFASTHSSTSHYDRARWLLRALRLERVVADPCPLLCSFVGLAWRPPKESICCEIYATGRANLPGSTRERSMLLSFARMLPELLRHSDRTDVFERMPQHLKDAHRPRAVERDDAPLSVEPSSAGLGGLGPLRPQQLSALWDEGEQDGQAAEALAMFASNPLDDDLALLDGAGF